jgi:hypothetical protein
MRFKTLNILKGKPRILVQSDVQSGEAMKLVDG